MRLLAQQSGWFRVVDRGQALDATVREQDLKDKGVLRQNGNTVHKGRGIEAQYFLTPPPAPHSANKTLGAVSPVFWA